MSRLRTAACWTVAAWMGGAVLPAAHAETRLEGEYTFLVDVRKQDRFFVWDFDSNNDDTFNQVDLRWLSTPYPGVELFLKTGAEWNRGANNNPRPRLQFREAHIRLRREWGARGVEGYLFSRQNRFWVDNHLIRAVDDVTGGNGQSVRIDTWGFWNVHTAAIYTDFSGVCLDQTRSPFGTTRCDSARSAETDDGYALRAWRPFFDDQLRVGLTWNRKNEREVADRGQDFQSTSVLAGDLRLTWRNTDYRLEFARGRENNLKDRIRGGDVPRDALDWRLGKLRWSDLQAALPDDIVLRGEVRAWSFGRPNIGFFNVAPAFWILGPQFRNQMGDSNNDEKGYALNTWYLIPARAITLTTNWVWYEKEFFQQRRVTEFYEEMYTEYVNGFTTKFSYRRRRTEDTNPDTGEVRVTRNDDLFGELVVENRLAWLRIQGLIKDLDTPFKKDIMAFETSVNVSQTVKIYNRFAFANDPGRQRKGLFTELQYRPTDNVELFLSYGPFWIGGGSNPVFEGNLQGSGDQRDLYRLTLKGNF